MRGWMNLTACNMLPKDSDPQEESVNAFEELAADDAWDNPYLDYHPDFEDMFGFDESNFYCPVETEYISLLEESKANRRRAAKLLAELKDREGELVYTKTLRNGAVVKTTSEEALDKYN